MMSLLASTEHTAGNVLDWRPLWTEVWQTLSIIILL